MTITNFLQHIEARSGKAARRNGKDWQTVCPSHPDKNPSLSIGEGSDGKILLRCFAGCETKAICDALGLTLADLMPDRLEPMNFKPRIVAEYNYTDDAGHLLYQVVRYSPKDFRQRQPDGNGGWRWNMDGVTRVLYRLPEVLGAIREHRPVYIVEGERDADTLTASGFTATTCPGGAGKWLDSYTETLTAADAIILPDRDEPGRKHARQVAEALNRKADRVRLVDLPATLNGKPIKDAADYFAAGGQPADLDTLTEAAPDWTLADTKPNRFLARVRRLGHLHPEAATDDPSELIQHRFLCRGGGLLINAPSGIGKSVLAMQFMVCWSIGLPTLGFTPKRPLQCLLVQAENDAGDMQEFKAGIYDGLNLTQEQRQTADAHCKLIHVDDSCGLPFILECLDPLCEAHSPDLVFIDPYFSYVGASVSDQEKTSAFLRNTLNPVLRKHNTGCVVIHHSNKPKSGREKPDWQAGELAYTGSGSIELTNWARAVIAIQSKGSHDIFQLHASKRGQRLKWVSEDGERLYSKFIAHGDRGIFWREVDPEEIPGPGRKKAHTAAQLVTLLDGESLTTTEWKKRADAEAGISKTSFYRLMDEAVAQKLVHQSKLDRKWFKSQNPK